MVTAQQENQPEQGEMMPQNEAQNHEQSGAESNKQVTETAAEVPAEPEQPTISVREQFAIDMKAATEAVEEAFKAVTAADLSPEQRDAAIEAYTEARKAQEALKEQESELEKKEKQELACIQLTKMSAQVFKRVGVDAFPYSFDPENGASVIVPKATRQRSSTGNGGEGVTRSRSTVRITVDSTEYTPSALMKEFGDEKLDNPKGAAAWNNDRTHPMFYASVCVRLMKAGKKVVVVPGDNPSDKHKAFDALVDTHKMRLGWTPEDTRRCKANGCSHAEKASEESS